jgi:hypothetical protein
VAKKADRVTFTGEAAQRVARATVAYEQGNRDKSPIHFRQVSDDGDPVMLAKTVATWPKGYEQTLDLYDVGPSGYETTATPKRTKKAFNRLCSVAANKWVIIGRASNGDWYLLNWECSGSG